nr:hypothetical protein [uncultured Flavobacterium sp.]
MNYFKPINKFAMILCFLLYLTCYLRFMGQLFLCGIQIISALFLTIEIFSKPTGKFINKITVYWILTSINLIIVVTFFKSVLENDFLQFPFITLFPNLIAIYFWRLLNQFIDYETKTKLS